MTRQNESNQDEPNEWEKAERVYNYLPKHSLEIAKPIYAKDFVFWKLYKSVNPLTPKIWLLILPSTCYIFPGKL